MLLVNLVFLGILSHQGFFLEEEIVLSMTLGRSTSKQILPIYCLELSFYNFQAKYTKNQKYTVIISGYEKLSV